MVIASAEWGSAAAESWDVDSPQQLNGYTYAADDPVTNSDPSGLALGVSMTPQLRACNTEPP
ncbi:MAG: hypothetical protein ABSD78_18210 [Acidimicrobiales bacterium]